jgi:hypothetical protein
VTNSREVTPFAHNKGVESDIGRSWHEAVWVGS